MAVRSLFRFSFKPARAFLLKKAWAERPGFWQAKWMLVLIILLHTFIPQTRAQVKNIGTPFIRNYDRAEYKAGLQTWMITSAPSGLMYYANNDGMIEFDGQHWRLYPLPGGSVVRSVKATPDGRVYAGGFNEMGYFSPDMAGKLRFTSLQGLLPPHMTDFGEVWRIYDLPQGIVFQSFEQLMIYKDDSIRIIKAPAAFHFSFLVEGELYINDEVEGIYRLANERLTRVPGTDPLRGQQIWAMLPHRDNILIATSDNGIYEFDGLQLSAWKTPAGDLLKTNQVYCGMVISETTYAFGSIQDGLVICDASGNIRHHINIGKGLQNNTVLSLQMDQYSNLWLGLDNGIDYVEINSPLTSFSSFQGLSAGYAAAFHDGLLYVGTNRGVFYQSWETINQGQGDQYFKLIPNTQSQAWDLQVVDGTLFCGHNAGIFVIEGTRARLLSDVKGGWTFIQPEDRDATLICGTFSGLVKFEKKGNAWQEGVKIKGFRESSRFLVDGGNNTIWMSHGYKGVFRIHLDQNYDSVIKVDFYNTQNGLPTNRDINAMEFKGKPVFTTGFGFYQYDARTNGFVPDEQMNSQFPVSDIRSFREDADGNVWYFTSNGAGVFRLQEDGNYVNVDVPFRELKDEFIKWFEFVYPMSNEHVFFGVKDGFVHYTPDHGKNYQKSFNAYIRSVEITGLDSILFWGTPPAGEKIEGIPYKFNHLQVEFSANNYENPGHIAFSTFLEGFDDDWTIWQERSMREFTNLRHGRYSFRVKARNIFGVESKISTLRFEIFPPWYLSWYAYVGYSLWFVAVFILMIVYVRNRLEKSKIKEQERQRKLFSEREKQLQTEAIEAEKEVIRLRNEKLREEMILKDKELANKTMQMIMKSKSLISIKKDLGKLSREIGDDLIAGQVNSLVRKINREIDADNQWEVFEKHFESVHEQFLRRLKARYPDLTPREMKLCAYLRLNISSKEIASLMNISTRGVEISRYRLRKKLELERDTNLTDFIMSF
jgi:DNA-binding CsgD family transcriptional regulator